MASQQEVNKTYTLLVVNHQLHRVFQFFSLIRMKHYIPLDPFPITLHQIKKKLHGGSIFPNLNLEVTSTLKA